MSRHSFTLLTRCLGLAAAALFASAATPLVFPDASTVEAQEEMSRVE